MSIRLVFCPGNKIWELFDDQGTPIEQANDFLRFLAARGSSNTTIRTYGYDLVALYRWLQNINKSIENIEQCDLVDFIKIQRENNAKPRSINRKLLTSRTFYRFLTDKEMPRGKGVLLLPNHYKQAGYDRQLGVFKLRNKSRQFLQVQVPRTLVEPLTREQVIIFLQSLKRCRDIAIVYLMLLCGLRVQEVLNIKVADLFMEEQRIKIRGKGNKERMLPLPKILITLIYDYMSLEKPPICNSDALFVILQGPRRGYPMSYSGLRSLFRHRRKNSILANANPHRMRHTYGRDMSNNGVKLPALQKLMGHSDYQTTLGYINLSLADITEEFLRASDKILKGYKSTENDT